MNHSGSDQREDPGMDRDDSNSGSGFAFCNPDETLPDVHISLLECQHLTDTHAGVKQDKYSVNTGGVTVRP